MRNNFILVLNDSVLERVTRSYLFICGVTWYCVPALVATAFKSRVGGWEHWCVVMITHVAQKYDFVQRQNLNIFNI